MIPYTPKDETANKYSIPTFISAKTKFSSKGITAQAINAKVIVTIGASINIILFEVAGIMISLKIYFTIKATAVRTGKTKKIIL